MTVIKAVKDATPEEIEFLEQTAHRIGTDKDISDHYRFGGFETLWEVWDRIDMLWLSRDDLSVIFSFDDSFSIAVIRVFDYFGATTGSIEVPMNDSLVLHGTGRLCIEERQNRSQNVVMNVDPWTSDRYQIAHLGHCGKHRLIVAKNKADLSVTSQGTTTYLDVGMVKRQEKMCRRYGSRECHSQ